MKAKICIFRSLRFQIKDYALKVDIVIILFQLSIVKKAMMNSNISDLGQGSPIQSGCNISDAFTTGRLNLGPHDSFRELNPLGQNMLDPSYNIVVRYLERFLAVEQKYRYIYIYNNICII